MEWFDKLIRSQSKQPVACYIGQPGPSATPDDTYLTIDIESLWITHVRRGLKKFYGAIYGNISVPYETGEKRIFQAFNPVADIQELDAKHLDRIVQGPYRLLDSVPYRGGGIDIRISLFSIKSADLAAPYIKLLKNISDTAGVAFINRMVPLVDVIQSGLSSLTGDNSLEIGRYGVFDSIQSGYYAVVRCDRNVLSTENLTFNEQTRSLHFNGKEIVEYPYFVLKISTSRERENWYSIPDIQNKFDRMKKQFEMAPTDLEKNMEYFDSFSTAVELSPDLISKHATKLVEEARERFAKYITEQRRSITDYGDPLALTLRDFNPFS